MKAAKFIAAVLATFIQMPIWYYILYKTLQATNASELTWFLFWIYVPLGFFTAIVAKLAAKE